ncbi:LOW QUALITY PROTEIN: F-actin-monooxygenase MICAL3-like [Dermacentor silvarum]|uniref:LOW QUALITY PROTEIN: F-actin-monooxygenase MICAL3-like n=1 Tax=Dermacentor silvarum TaxID=543639 RepID=UPI0021009A17|nr:LOW QUALITY PROTEIN: F-actin-monooxygenase MICAL3-like [Dermacentor silvarum]
MAMRGARGTPTGLPQAMSPESALASDIFDQFVSAGTFKAALSTYRQMCDVLQLSPSPLPVFYPRLKVKLRSWRAASLWAKLDKRAAHKCYNRGKACAGMRVLIIGGGPCGLRTAIEAQLLGAKVVVLEKRDRYSRNNVLHLWPFVIHDLRSLGAKKFFGKFCAGSIDHISIRQLQLILLKIALLLGVEVHENVTFKDLLEPPEDQSMEKIGWRAQVMPADHPASQYEFDVLIGADGKRNTLKGFNRREFRGKLAIAITANFMNRHTLEEARVQEISGVAFIFNQRFFQDMKETTGIDLENIVYYKDDTHYFVMTAKKQSLLERGVIINDYSDTARLLSPDNVDRSALKEYARDAADFATGYALPCLEFAVNHYGQPDVAMFDFTSMYAADNASRLLERHGHWLLQGLVGDSLLEPFWPTGSGCARGFLSSLDAAWMIRSWAANRDSPLHVLAERESIYRLLAQTTPENLSKDMAEYSLNPSSRYPNLNLQTVLPSQVRPLCRTDIEIKLPPPGPRLLSDMQRKRRRRESIIHPDALLSWCQRQVALYSKIKIENMTSSWKDGLALCAILHRYRPDLIDLDDMSTADVAANNQQAFDILEREYGIPPVMTGQEMADCAVPDKLTMVSYISQIYETFRREIPQGRPAYKVSKLIEENQPPPTSPLNLLAKLTSSQRPASKRKSSNDHEPVKDRSEGQRRSRVSITRSRRTRDRVADIVAGGDAATLEQYHKILSAMDKESFGKRMHALQEQLGKDYRPSSRGSRGRRSGHVSSATEDESSSVTGKIPRTAVEQLQEQLNSIGKPVPVKKREPKVGRIGKDEWNVKMLEERLRQQQKRQKEPKVEPEKPQILRDIFESKRNVMDARLKADGKETETDRARFTHIDERLQQLDRQLKEGSLDVGKRGANRVAAMADYIANVLDAQTGLREKRPPPPPPVVLYRSDSADGAKTPPLKKPPITQPAVPTAKSAPTSKQPAPTPTTTKLTDSGDDGVGGVGGVGVVGGGVGGSVSEICCFCHKRVYLMERLSAEGLFFHRNCFRCEFCQCSLRLGNYAYDSTIAFKGKFYCTAHFRMERPSQRWQEMMKRKQAFLSANPEPPSLMPAKPASTEDTNSTLHRRRSPSPPHGGAGEGMEDPTKMEEVRSPPAGTDAGVVTFQPKTYKTPRQLSAEEMATLVDVDSTPERVEFENTLELLSEDELLTSELEEEELAQKNLGAVEVPTSDDEYSDYSSDEGSESESLVEEIEHSLNLDDTRHMAETWQRKHASSLDVATGVQDEVGNGVALPRSPTRSPGADDEEESDEDDEETSTEGEEDYDEGEEEEEDEEDETETETGDEDATSHDVDSDEEYSPPEVLSDDEHGRAASAQVCENGKDDVVSVPVPILNKDKGAGEQKSSTGSDDEYISDEEGITMSSSDVSSESEEEPPPPKHEIPVIIIDTPPGDQDTELDWGPKEVRAALGQVDDDASEPEADGIVDEAAHLGAGSVPEGMLGEEQTTPVSPRSSENQTSSDQLSIQKSGKLSRSAESLANASVSSGLSSSSNVDKFSEPVHAAGEAVPAIVENLESPSLTDVSDVSGATGTAPSSTTTSSKADRSPEEGKLGYNLLLDRAGSSGSSPLPTPEREVGAAFESDGDVSSESSAIRFGKLTGRESEASSSVASSSHYSVSSTGDGKSSGADDSSSEEHGPLVLKEHSPDVATPLEGMKECVSLGNKDISRTASGEPELSEGALLQVSTTALSDRPDSSETSTTDTCEEATVVHRQPLQADDGDVSPTGSLLDHVAAGIHVAQLLEGKGERAVDAMELVHPIASFNEESLGVLQFVPTKPGSPTGTDYVPTVEQEASNVSKGGIQKIADRTKLALDLNKDEPAAPKGETPDILSPRSDVTDEDTTCSASISDQEVFPTDADKLVTLEDPAVPSPVPQPVPRELMHAPIASMSDEDDLTASDLSRRGLQHGKSEPSVSKKTLLETMKEVQEAIGAAAAATPMGQQSDGDDFTVSEWAREGGDKESLSFVEDLKAEFSFDDKNVTRRRRRKRVSSGNKEDTEEAIEAVNIDHLKPSQEALDERLGGHLEPPQPSNTALTIITSGHDVKTSLQVDSTVAEVPGHHKGHSPLREPPRYQGYGGSFVEKVRSRSSEGTGAGSGEPQVPSGDVIYLRSLNINLQRLDFPSIRSSSPSSRGSCEELDSDCGLTAAGGTGPVVQSTQPPVARSAPVKIERPVKSADPRIRVRPNQFPESFPMSSTPLRPCADPVTAMLMSRREQLARKSVHEDIQNLPYFDSLSLAGDFDEFKTPPEANTPTETFGTPPTSRPCYLSALHAATDPERERARREARERARLKSDEELGLSPCSYRKKYARTPAFDEITLTDLLDQEDETFNALDDRSSLRSFSTAQHRLAQFEDDDEFGGGLDDNGNDSATPVASPARSTDDLDGIDDIVVGGITLMDPYQIRADVWKPKPPKPKRRLFARNEDDDRKTTPSPAASTTRRNLLSFLGFNRSSSGGDSSAATTKEKKESYNREKAAKDVAENERTKSFSRLRLSKTPRQEKSSSPKKVPAAKSDSAPCSTERVNASPELVAPKAAAVVSSVSRQHSHQPRPVVREEMKKHISLDNLKSQPMQLPAKSRSIEFGIMTAPRATGEEDGFADSDDRDLDGSAETGGPGDKKAKAIDPRKLERLTLRVQRQQERKRQRTAQELQRRLEEIEVSLRSLEHRGVLVERALRGEEDEDEDLQAEEKDLTQVLFRLMRQKNKLSREEQELLIRVKDLELEDQQSKLQQEMRERMAIDDAEKSPRDIEKEREILNEMLEIVEKRDRLVAQMDQLRIREETEEKELAARILTQGAT